METENLKNLPKKAKSLSDYARYSNLAFQMIAILAVGVFGGIGLDRWLKLKFPVFTVILSFLAVISAIYYGIKDFIRTKRK
jgi:F0F1-type ATP synthase assembly protein I